MRNAPSLAELQRDFAASVLHGDASIEAAVAGNGLAAAQRMQIYRHIIENTFSEALQTSYPAVRLLVGDDFFDLAALRYLRDYPATSGNLQDYGAHFAAFLAAMPEASSLAYLPDIARLEWARQCSLLAADAEPLSADAVTQRLHTLQQSEAAIALRLHPSLQIIASDYPLFDIWRYCMEPDETPPPALDRGGQPLLIWRDAAQIAMQPVSAATTLLLRALLDGQSIQTALTTAADADFDLTELLPWLVANRLVIDITAHKTAQ